MTQERIYKYYKNVIAEDLLILLNYDNIMQLPQMRYAVISNTDSTYLVNKKQGISAFAALSLLTGQKNVPTRAHKSIAAFKVREGNFLGCKVTIRKKALNRLLDQLISFVFVYTQNYKLAVTENKNTKCSLNIGIQKLGTFPSLEKFFVFFESLKGCNICFVLFCPELKLPTSVHNAQSQFFSLPSFFLRSFQIPLYY